MKTRKHLRVFRAERNISQETFRRLLVPHLGRLMSQGRYSQIETGNGPPPSKEERDAIAAAWGVRVIDIAWPPEPIQQVSAHV